MSATATNRQSISLSIFTRALRF